MRGSLPFQKLVLMFGALYPEYAGGEIYDSVSRDYRESKGFMQDKDWSSEEMENRLREVMPQYFQDSYWREQRFPAFGLFMQFNKFKPNPIKVVEKVKRTGQMKSISALMTFCTEHPDQLYLADKRCPKCEKIEV